MLYIITFFVVAVIIVVFQRTFSSMSDKEFKQRKSEKDEFVKKHGRQPAYFREYHEYSEKHGEYPSLSAFSKMLDEKKRN